ncbi:MAG: hypothetical protein WA208_00105 [Thermoanaerobaculia bacterium]
MGPEHVQQQYEVDGEPISLSRLAQTIRRYSGVLFVGLAAVVAAYLIGATAVLLMAETQRVTSMPFRLEFSGADQGRYPNGLKFGVSDITAAPVLREVWDTNQLSRFVNFHHFSRSMFVLEANRELDQLTAEYQARLSDTKLTAIDRERIEREFQSKRAGISKSDYAIQFVPTDATRKIPQALIPKLLDDTLRTWARRASVEKRALDYYIPVLSANVLSDIRPDRNGYLVPLLLLRRRVDDIMRNVESIAAIPGAELVRTRKDRASLEEIRLKLDELVRFRLEPLISSARSAGLLGNSTRAVQLLRAQLAHDQRQLAAARGRETALRQALATYESSTATRIGPADITNPAAERGRDEGAKAETVMPQLSEGFLDRIVSLADRNSDREYRQRVTDEIRGASLAMIPLESAVAYDMQMIDAVQAAPAGNDTASVAELETAWTALRDDVRQAILDMNEIYLLASRQVYPDTELFRVLGPPSSSTHRSVSANRIALGGVLTLLIALPLLLVGIFVHNRIREEEQASRTTTLTSPT